MFSLQQILGDTTLDMVRCYVYFASCETTRRPHAAASPEDGLTLGPKVSVFGLGLQDLVSLAVDASVHIEPPRYRLDTWPERTGGTH